MTRTVFCLICIFAGMTLSFSVQAQEPDLTKNFGIGLQGATSEFGGVSFRYTGLAPIYLQTVGRFILNDQNSDHMLGGGVSYAIFEHQGRWHRSRLYFTLEGGWRYKKEPEFTWRNRQIYDVRRRTRFWRRTCVLAREDSARFEHRSRSRVWQRKNRITI